MAETDQKELEKKMKAYVKQGRRAARGSRRSKKKLRKMAENDFISVISKKATNHPAWYTKLGGELIGLNYGMIDQIGNRGDLIKDSSGHVVQTRTTTDVIIPLCLTATKDDTIRVAAQKIVNELRLVSGANTIYDVDDMVDYLLNIRSIWAALTQIRRAIRCLNATDPYDIDAWRKYLMMSLYEIDIPGATPTGFSESFRKNAANIVNWLNTIVKSVRFMMPGNFSLFERTSWLFSNIFVDGTGKKFGSKMFVTPTLPYYTHAPGSTVHTATKYKLMLVDQTVDQMVQNVQAMVTDFTTKVANVAIAGDLMKAYGMKSFYDPGQISFEEKPSFVFDERALEQIMNIDVCGDFRAGNTTYQYDGVNPPLTFQIAAGTMPIDALLTRTATLQTKFVNTEDNVVEAGETLSLTRFKSTVEYTVDSSNNIQCAVNSCGTEVVLDYLYIGAIIAPGVLEVVTTITLCRGLSDSLPTAAIGSLCAVISCWAMDDYGPMTFIHNANSGAPVPGVNDWVGYPIFDFSNWALMSIVEQSQFHKTAILSMLTPSASVVQQAVAVLQ